jgi:hypothetical protein
MRIRQLMKADKHFVTSSDSIVVSACRGIIAAHPGLVFLEADRGPSSRPVSSPEKPY